jgi:Phytanoyl-CoA dioxygenase (PhyH)
MASVTQSTQERVEAAIRVITDEEIATYREQGWVKLERLLDPALAEELLAAAEQLVAAEAGEPTVGWFAMLKSPSAQHELFNAVVYSKKMTLNAVRLLRAVLPGNYDAVRYWTDNIFAKYPDGGSTETPFHQDFGNEHSEDRSGKINFWIALDEVAPERGAMRFFSGAHTLGVLGASVGVSHAGAKPLLEVYPQLPEWFSLETASLQPGDATSHQALMVHGAGANTSGKTRWSLDAIYIQPDVCFSGGAIGAGANLGVEVGHPFDHPALPLLRP